MKMILQRNVISESWATESGQDARVMVTNHTKVVFVLPGIAGGGAEKVVLNLYKALELYHGYECHIISLSRNVAHAVDAELRVHYLDQAMRVGKHGSSDSPIES